MARRRSRKRRSAAPAEAQLQRGYARSAERDAAARAGLEPLAPGERPVPLVVAAVLAAALAVANLAALAADVEVGGGRPGGAGGVALFAALMLAAAWGMWNRRVWAVLAFEAMLAITLAVAALSLLVASNVAAAVLCLVLLGGGGWLFWKLVRVMARLQAPPRVG